MKNNNKDKSKAAGYIVVNAKGEPTSNIYSKVGPAKAYITTILGESGKRYSVHEVVLGDLVITGEEHLDKKRIKDLKKEIEYTEYRLNVYRDEGKFDGITDSENKLKNQLDELDKLMLKYRN